MTTQADITDLAIRTVQEITLNANQLFNGAKAGSSNAWPRWAARNGNHCGLRLTAGAGVMVELVEYRGSNMHEATDSKVYARQPMTNSIREAAEFIAAAESAWMDTNNAAA